MSAPPPYSETKENYPPPTSINSGYSSIPQAPPAYSQPPQGPNGPLQSNVTVVTTQPTAVYVHQFRDFPVQMTCTRCNAQILTATDYEIGALTWVLAAVLCFFFWWLLCCLIPFCLDSTKDVIHTCPNCHQMLGRFNRI